MNFGRQQIRSPWQGQCGSCGRATQHNYDANNDQVQAGYTLGVPFPDQLFVEYSTFGKDHKGQPAISKLTHYARRVICKSCFSNERQMILSFNHRFQRMIKVYSAEYSQFLHDYNYFCDVLGIGVGKYTDRGQCCLKDASKAPNFGCVKRYTMEELAEANKAPSGNVYKSDANDLDMVNILRDQSAPSPANISSQNKNNISSSQKAKSNVKDSNHYREISNAVIDTEAGITRQGGGAASSKWSVGELICFLKYLQTNPFYPINRKKQVEYFENKNFQYHMDKHKWKKRTASAYHDMWNRQLNGPEKSRHGLFGKVESLVQKVQEVQNEVKADKASISRAAGDAKTHLQASFKSNSGGDTNTGNKNKDDSDINIDIPQGLNHDGLYNNNNNNNNSDKPKIKSSKQATREYQEASIQQVSNMNSNIERFVNLEEDKMRYEREQKQNQETNEQARQRKQTEIIALSVTASIQDQQVLLEAIHGNGDFMVLLYDGYKKANVNKDKMLELLVSGARLSIHQK